MGRGYYYCTNGIANAHRRTQGTLRLDRVYVGHNKAVAEDAASVDVQKLDADSTTMPYHLPHHFFWLAVPSKHQCNPFLSIEYTLTAKCASMYGT